MIEADTERGMMGFSEVGSPLADAQEVASNPDDTEVVPPFGGSKMVAAVVPTAIRGDGRRDDSRYLGKTLLRRLAYAQRGHAGTRALPQSAIQIYLLS